MKMGKASDADLEMAIKVCNFLESIEKGYMPEAMESDETFFETDDPEQCQKALAKLIEICKQGSLFRVCFGMLVVCDPRNELLDPDADTLEHHPKVKQLEDENDALKTEVDRLKGGAA